MHGLKYLGVPPTGLNERIALRHPPGGFHRVRARQPVGEKGQRNEHQRADQRCEPEQRMEQIANREIERDPR